MYLILIRFFNNFIFPAEKIRVGRDFQVVCPDLIPEPSRNPEILNDRALLVWSPTKDIPESKCKLKKNQKTS
jgi:hypothetical protein